MLTYTARHIGMYIYIFYVLKRRKIGYQVTRLVRLVRFRVFW